MDDEKDQIGEKVLNGEKENGTLPVNWGEVPTDWMASWLMASFSSGKARFQGVTPVHVTVKNFRLVHERNLTEYLIIASGFRGCSVVDAAPSPQSKR